MHIILIIALTMLSLTPVHAAQPAPQQTDATSHPASSPSHNKSLLHTATAPDSKPSRGMSMKKVARLFGAPIRKLPATGKPPIERWVYQDFTVYFEGKYVIHAVKNQPATTPTTVN